MLLVRAAVSWNSKKQTLVPLLTEETEHTAFTAPILYLHRIRQLLQEIQGRDTAGLHYLPMLQTAWI